MVTERHRAAGFPLHSLAVFRIAFGLLMTVAMLRFLARGWVDELFLQPDFHFPYPGFGWIRPWPDGWMQAHVALVAAAALGVAVGFHYRACIVLFFAGFSYLELIDQTTYLNHYYLVSLVAGLLAFMPAHRVWSLDALRRPALAGDTGPAWPVRLLRFQFAVVYFFAGVAKLDADWLFEAQPLRIWLAARSDLPGIGPWLEHAPVAYAASWTGAVFDLGAPFLLLWHRTRPFAFAAVVGFHLFTGLLFPIGMFPWIMIAGATLFFPRDWPLRKTRRDALPAGVPGKLPSWGLALIFIHCALQIALPLRGPLSGRSGSWCGRGFNWSWKVMLVEKRGSVSFHARDPLSGKRWRIDPSCSITPRQAVMMAQDPHLIRDFARHLAAVEHERGRPGVEIRADAFVTLNGRPSRRIIDPRANLAGPLDPGWILPPHDAPAADRLSFR
jgi:vitamin K-dependent gamma-carboxylase